MKIIAVKKYNASNDICGAKRRNKFEEWGKKVFGITFNNNLMISASKTDDIV